MKTIISALLVLGWVASLNSADLPGYGLDKNEKKSIHFSGKVKGFDSSGRMLTLSDFNDNKSRYEIKISDETVFRDKRGVVVPPYQLGPETRWNIAATNIDGNWKAIDIRPWVHEVGDPRGTNKPNFFPEKPGQPIR